jgi:1-acyl-sn-glycerol-3-phosphate acyltransferase
MYFRKIRLVNPTRKFFGSTIYVSNHASAFMDPMIIAVLRRPIVFFMTRSDIFTKWNHPFLSSAHMIPIYRQHDGGNAAEKNKTSFRKATEILASNRNLLIFGEGMTDDVFERRLKPLKKGALRIGFTALESTNWEKKIQIIGIGCNYTNPNVMRSDLLIAESKPILLNDYREQYEENPSKTINELNRILEQRLAGEITHIALDQDFAFHEQVMKITRKGMDPYCFDNKIPLVQRWKYSKSLADYINQFGGEYPQKITDLKVDLASYFESLATEGLTEDYFFQSKQKTNFLKVLLFVFSTPFAFIGFLHAYVPYIVVKMFVEKTFKRKVFWCSTKMVLTMFAMLLMNLPLLFIAPNLFDLSFLVVFSYYLSIGLLSLVWYEWRRALINWKSVRNAKKCNASDILWNKREALVNQIQQVVELNNN